MTTDSDRRRMQRRALALLRHPIALHARSEAAMRRGDATEVGSDLRLPPRARDAFRALVASLEDGRQLQPEAVAAVVELLPASWQSPEDARLSEMLATREGRDELARRIRGSHGITDATQPKV